MVMRSGVSFLFSLEPRFKLNIADIMNFSSSCSSKDPLFNKLEEQFCPLRHLYRRARGSREFSFNLAVKDLFL